LIETCEDPDSIKEVAAFAKHLIASQAIKLASYDLYVQLMKAMGLDE